MNFKKELMNFFLGVMDYSINSYLIVDSVEYEIERFQTYVEQGHDHKGQPQSETKGGQFSIVLKQTVTPSIYDWAKRQMKLKSGSIKFSSETSGTVFQINFFNGACISLSTNVNNHSGTTTMLVISAEKVTFYDNITIDNRWQI